MRCGVCDREATWVVNEKWLVCDGCAGYVREVVRVHHAVRIGGLTIKEEKLEILPLPLPGGPEHIPTSTLPFFAKAKADAVAAGSTE